MKTILLVASFFATSIQAAGRTNTTGQTRITEYCKLWSEPNRFGKATALLKPGLPVEVLRYRSTKKWTQIKTPGGRVGWVPVKFTEIESRYSSEQLDPYREPWVRDGFDKKRKQKRGDRNPGSLGEAVIIDESGEYQFGEVSDEDVDSLTGELDSLGGSGGAVPTEGPEAGQEGQWEILDTNDDPQKDKRRGEKRRGQKEKPSSRKAKPFKESPEGINGHYVESALEYANQLSIGKTHGFGITAGGGYYVIDNLAIGVGLLWNRFYESADTGSTVVKRRAFHMLLGPTVRYSLSTFSFDLWMGWDKISTKVDVQDASGNPVSSSLAGSYSESAFGLMLKPSYKIWLKKSLFLQFYMAYTIGFYGGESLVQGEAGSKPQHLSLGVGAQWNL